MPFFFCFVRFETVGEEDIGFEMLPDNVTKVGGPVTVTTVLNCIPSDHIETMLCCESINI